MKQETYTEKCEVSQSTKSKRNIQRAIKVPHTENAHVQIVLSAIIHEWHTATIWRQRESERKKSVRIHIAFGAANNETR